MFVYNIRKEKYAGKLIASGVANRWNKNDEFIIYTGSSRALSALELVVHKSVININARYKLMVIKLEIDDSDIASISVSDLPDNWRSMESYPGLQQIGSEWYRDRSFLVLKVPSVIISQEFNYLVNTTHPDFMKKVKVDKVEDFLWDERLL